MSRRSESPWHTLIVTDDSTDNTPDLVYEIDHPDVCPLQTSVEHPRCWFDGTFFEVPRGSDEIPREPGVYRARVWQEDLAPFMCSPDYDSGNEWELIGGES